MAPCALACVLLQLFLLSNAQRLLTVYPVDPVVSVGESLQLNCSITCPSGTVVWKGLDNTDNGQYIAPGYSVQTLQNISISMEGTRICVGSCPGNRHNYQRTVQLYVYALPKMLLLNTSIKNGVRYLSCSMERVFPPPNITCYRGSQGLGDAADISEVSDADNLYNVTWSWALPDEDWITETSYWCEAQVQVSEQLFTRQGALRISSKDTSTAVTTSSPSQIPSTPSGQQEDTTLGSQKSSTAGKHTKTSTISTFTTRSTRPPAAETTYMTTTISTSSTPETMRAAQESNTPESQPSAITGEYTETSTITTASARPTQPTKPNNPIDGLYLMWTIGPATGLLGGFLLALQIYRQLSRKGFFQPNQKEFSTVKKDPKSQGSLQAVLCYDVSPTY